MAACPRLTELTLIYPYPGDPPVSETGVPLDVVGTTHSAALELVNACKSLPDFDTIQIVHILAWGTSPPAVRAHQHMRYGGLSAEQLLQVARDPVNDVKDLVIDCLKRPEMGCQEGERRKRAMVRVIELCRYRPPGKDCPGSLRINLVEEYEVRGFDF